MKKTYHFWGEDPIEFEDSKTVKELVEYAFEQFDYYEPFGMDSVTVFQCHHPNSDYGWFTTDSGRRCADEIENRDELCFGYYIPGFLYYAEGGWGHHMHYLGNHPIFKQPVPLKLRFDDFDHTVVFEGTHSFREVLDLFKKVGYVDSSIANIKVQVLAYRNSLPISCCAENIEICSPILDLPMSKFEMGLPQGRITTLVLD